MFMPKKRKKKSVKKKVEKLWKKEQFPKHKFAVSHSLSKKKERTQIKFPEKNRKM